MIEYLEWWNSSLRECQYCTCINQLLENEELCLNCGWLARSDLCCSSTCSKTNKGTQESLQLLNSDRCLPPRWSNHWTKYLWLREFDISPSSWSLLTLYQTAWNFGLLNRTYPSDKKSYKKLSQWERFEKYVDSLNSKCGKDTQYKVLFMGRHGQGYHNAAESYFGTPAWNVSLIFSYN